MIFNRLETLADAISYYHQSYDPKSSAYQNRNPGQLKAFALKHARDEHGYRMFTSLLDGYQALLYDLKIKASGASKARFPENPTIKDLMKSYGQDGALVGRYIAKYITKALGQTVTENTELRFFLE